MIPITPFSPSLIFFGGSSVLSCPLFPFLKLLPPTLLWLFMPSILSPSASRSSFQRWFFCPTAEPTSPCLGWACFHPFFLCYGACFLFFSHLDLPFRGLRVFFMGEIRSRRVLGLVAGRDFCFSIFALVPPPFQPHLPSLLRHS